MNRKIILILLLLLVAVFAGCEDSTEPAADDAARDKIVTADTRIAKLAGGFRFTEGPADDGRGNVYFSDIPNNKILKWSADGKLSTFMSGSGGANGLYFDKSGALIACQGGSRQLSSIDATGKVKVLADKYDGKYLNSPNDLWIDAKGGIYFTDPRYGNRSGMAQDGEHVYYLAAGAAELVRVVDDMVRPNGLIGSVDGKKLYVADAEDGKTFVYNVNADGTLADKKLFAAKGSDGMTVDGNGNIYLTPPGESVVAVYDAKGKLIESIEFPESPANICFGGKDKQTLFVTARTSFYSVKTSAKGL